MLEPLYFLVIAGTLAATVPPQVEWVERSGALSRLECLDRWRALPPGLRSVALCVTAARLFELRAPPDDALHLPPPPP